VLDIFINFKLFWLNDLLHEPLIGNDRAARRCIELVNGDGVVMVHAWWMTLLFAVVITMAPAVRAACSTLLQKQRVCNSERYLKKFKIQ